MAKRAEGVEGVTRRLVREEVGDEMAETELGDEGVGVLGRGEEQEKGQGAMPVGEGGRSADWGVTEMAEEK